MNRSLFQWQSLQTRITLVTLAVFLVGIWALTLFASHVLRKDMESQLGAQQLSTLSVLAAQVNEDLGERLRGLEIVAGSISPAILGNAASLQTLLEQRQLLQRLFNGGVIALDPDGAAIVDVPSTTGRPDMNYLDVDTISAALREGKSTVGRPTMGRTLMAPVFGMTAPIRDAEGRVIGALCGVTNLGKPNFLDKITDSPYGKTGGYLVADPQHRLNITATDKSRVMQPLPPPGISPSIDRFVGGYEGTLVYVNQLGVEVLVSARNIPVAGWKLVANLPIAEAFAPVRAMQKNMLAAAIFLSFLAGVLMWWILRRQLAPLLATVDTLAALSDTDVPPQPLPINSRDEIGQLIGGFNRLLEKMRKRDDALQEHTSQLKALSRRVLEAQETERRRVAIELHDELGQALTAIKFNLQAHARLNGQTPAELNAENIDIIEEALQQVRRLALALRPSMLDDLGLIPALRWIAEQTETRGDLVVQVRAAKLPSRLTPEIETACFRIVQEALTNIVRHAQAQLVEIDLTQDADTFILCVQDDGCGFDPAAMHERALTGGSMGVLGMQERATLIGAQLEISSAPGQGCRVRLCCPLHQSGEATT